MDTRHHVVIIGGGFGGLYAAKSMKNKDLRITIVDRRNFHLFQPLLYQVATGGLSPGDIASPLRAILRKRKNIQVLLGEVVDFDVGARKVILSDGELPYDTLIVAAGARHHYFGNDQWEQMAPGLKTIEDATEIRRRILLAFEAAEREPNPETRRAWLTFVVVGAGPTGVELAGALGEIANDTLKGDFRDIDPSDSRILLVDASSRVLPPYPPELSAKAEQALIHLGVRTLPGMQVVGIDSEGVSLKDTAGEIHRIHTHTVLWAAGVQASPLGAALARKTGAQLDRAGRIVVEPDLSLPGHPEILVIGDMALVNGKDAKPLPGVAPVAMQQGRYVAGLVAARVDGASTPPPFEYWNKGNLATIGRAAAVADFGRLRFDGFLAWFIWVFVHLMYLVGFQNRLVVFLSWAVHYFTFKRRARMITGPDPFPLVRNADRNGATVLTSEPG